MTKIFIDECGIVRVDTTDDGRRARQADINRHQLKMVALLEGLALCSARVSRNRNRSTVVQEDALDELGFLRSEIVAEAAIGC